MPGAGARRVSLQEHSAAHSGWSESISYILNCNAERQKPVQKNKPSAKWSKLFSSHWSELVQCCEVKHGALERLQRELWEVLQELGFSGASFGAL